MTSPTRFCNRSSPPIRYCISVFQPRLMPPLMFNILPQPNFWLRCILIPWTIGQRFFYTTFTEPQYRMPAEWEPHHRTMMAWPDRISVERDAQLHHAWTELANIAEAVAKYEPVWLYTSPANFKSAKSWVSRDVTVVETDLEQLWMRDTGPLFVNGKHGKQSAIDLNFNYWGSKLSFPKSLDKTLTARILGRQQVLRNKAPFTAEGGGLEVDGQGTLLATESSILNPNRNPGMTKEELELIFLSHLGVTKTIWIPGARGLDITDAHIDALARFTPNDTVLLSRPNQGMPAHDISWRVYNQAKAILQSSTNALGHDLRLIEIEEALTVPYERIDDSEGRPATSYVNYYLPNGAVVVPQFGEERTDNAALEVMSEVWPGREIVGVTLDFLPWLGGGVHCATMQWPAGGQAAVNVRAGEERPRVGDMKEDEL